MKRGKYLLLLVFAIVTISVYGDVIIFKNPHAKICVKIENIGDYPDMVIVGVSDCLSVFSKPKVDIIDSTSCLEVHKACPLIFYAVKKDYLEKKGIKKINWKKDKNVRKSDITIDANKSEPIFSPSVVTLELNYFIAGFNENSMVIICKTSTYKFSYNHYEVINHGLWGTEPEDFEKYIESLNLQKSF
jgi:hypothetical protein